MNHIHRTPVFSSLIATLILAGCCGLSMTSVFAQEPTTQATPQVPPTAPKAIAVPEAMRANLKTQSIPIQFSQTLPITQGMVTISAAASNQASSQVSAPADGQVIGDLPQLGQSVQAGQTLFELASAGLADLQAQWSMAQAKASLAQQSLSRDQSLFADGLIAKKRLEESRSMAQSASAELSAASARLKLSGVTASSKNMSSNLAVRAPISGVVTQRKIMPGERVSMGQALLEITASADQWWLMAVPPAKAPMAGQQATLHIVGCPEPAPVRLIDLTVDPMSQLVTLRAEPALACASLRPGQMTNASLWVQQVEPVIALPIGAITELDNQPQVFVQRGESYFLVPVQLRGEFDGMAYVSGDFQSQDRVITNGMSRLKAVALGMGGE
ncbi:MAG: efflux RND transporter periplasmic adaptor subunit [Halothiobacillaceae bacterium]|nr:efflux RND transporter periplasmic adaptor subunit [Halothiobacillaceae bacterium]